MQTLQHFINSPAFGQLVTLLLSSGGVSFVAQLLKRLGKLESEKIIQFLVIALAVAASALQYVMSGNLQSISVLGINTAAIVGGAQALYLYGVKPLTKFVDQVKAYNDNANQTPAQQPSSSWTTTPPAPITPQDQPQQTNEFTL